MIEHGYALVGPAGVEIAWWPTIPDRIDLPSAGLVILSAAEGWSYADHAIVARDRTVADPPDTGTATLPLLSRRQVLFGLFEDGFITLAEFEASATAVPASIAAIIAAAPGFDDASKAREKVRFLTMEYARRDHPLTLMLQASRPGTTDAEVDAMWLRWAAL
ncbi:hypothetical protein [Rhodoplanes elegans]|nr:hypothetical protein [Rhodoplanes elegans]